MRSWPVLFSVAWTDDSSFVAYVPVQAVRYASRVQLVNPIALLGFSFGPGFGMFPCLAEVLGFSFRLGLGLGRGFGVGSGLGPGLGVGAGKGSGLGPGPDQAWACGGRAYPCRLVQCHGPTSPGLANNSVCQGRFLCSGRAVATAHMTVDHGAKRFI